VDECQIVTINRSVDLDPILAIEQLSFQCPWGRRSFEGELSCPSGLSYVVKSALTDKGAQIVAYAFLRRVLDELHLLKIAVTPSRRGSGIANWFLNYCFTMGAQQRANSVYLEVRLSNIAAIKLYEKLGFREIGRRSNYYPDSKEDAVAMMKNIEMNLPLRHKGTRKARIKKNLYSCGSKLVSLDRER
jgi:ribosomal-protein-alanine N-acetyltransferase